MHIIYVRGRGDEGWRRLSTLVAEGQFIYLLRLQICKSVKRRKNVVKLPDVIL